MKDQKQDKNKKNIVRKSAQKYTKQAIETIFELMNSSDSPASTRLSAAESLLTRGWGKGDNGEIKDNETVQDFINFISSLDKPDQQKI